MEFVKPINFGMRRDFPENEIFSDNPFKITERIAVQMIENFENAVASCILNEMGAQGATTGVVLNKEAITTAMLKQTPMQVGRKHNCPRCGRPLHRPTGIGNEHYCIFCGQLVTWRKANEK